MQSSQHVKDIKEFTIEVQTTLFNADGTKSSSPWVPVTSGNASVMVQDGDDLRPVVPASPQFIAATEEILRHGAQTVIATFPGGQNEYRAIYNRDLDGWHGIATAIVAG